MIETHIDTRIEELSWVLSVTLDNKTVNSIVIRIGELLKQKELQKKNGK